MAGKTATKPKAEKKKAAPKPKKERKPTAADRKAEAIGKAPTGFCFCGCGTKIESKTAYFVRGHDRKALGEVVDRLYGGVPGMLLKVGGYKVAANGSVKAPAEAAAFTKGNSQSSK